MIDRLCVMTTDRELLELWRNVHHMNIVIRSTLGRRLELASGCTLTEHDLMSWLDVDGTRRPRMLDLAALLGLTQGGVTRLVDRLVGRGWVTREQLPGNRREIYARLTGQGKIALGHARAAYLEALRETVTGRLGEEDIAALSSVTGRFVSLPELGIMPGRAQDCPE